MDKDSIPADQAAPKTPELQETLENTEEVKTEVQPEVEAKTEAPVEEAPVEETPAEKPAAKPESILDTVATAEPAKPSNQKTIVIILVVIVALIMILGISAFAIIKFSEKKDPLGDLYNAASDFIDDTKEQVEKEMKELKEKEKKEKEEKEQKEKEEKEKAEKEKEEAEKKAKEEAAKKKTSTNLNPESLAEEAATILNRVSNSEVFAVKETQHTIFKPSGFNTNIMLNGYGAGLTNYEALSDTQETLALDELRNFLLSYGFEETDTYTYDLGDADETYFNSRNNISCSIGLKLEKIDTYTPLNCAFATSYDLNEKSLVNSLAEAYKKAKKEYPTYIWGSCTEANKVSDCIRDSDYKNYQTIYVSTGINAAVVFYRESPTKEWIYLTATQAAIDCRSYSSDLKKALGDQCEKE